MNIVNSLGGEEDTQPVSELIKLPDEEPSAILPVDYSKKYIPIMTGSFVLQSVSIEHTFEDSSSVSFILRRTEASLFQTSSSLDFSLTMGMVNISGNNENIIYSPENKTYSLKVSYESDNDKETGNIYLLFLIQIMSR